MAPASNGASDGPVDEFCEFLDWSRPLPSQYRARRVKLARGQIRPSVRSIWLPTGKTLSAIRLHRQTRSYLKMMLSGGFREGMGSTEPKMTGDQPARRQLRYDDKI